MLSIIIPTLNEEKYLPGLLVCIKKQFSGDYEIIVADAGSTDKTIAIANSYNVKIVPGGLPAKARNNGAAAAKGQTLLFLDADVLLPEHFFEYFTQEYGAKGLQIAGFLLRPYPAKAYSYFLINTFYNSFIKAVENYWPHGAMGIAAEAGLFKKVGGFDETITLAEDHDFIRRAAKMGKYGIIKSTEILFSERRFVTDGWLNTGVKYFLCGLYNLFIGPIRTDIFKYKFNHYKDKK